MKNKRETKRAEPMIIGYGFDGGDEYPRPIFSSEQSGYRKKIFTTAEEARKALERINKENNN